MAVIFHGLIILPVDGGGRVVLSLSAFYPPGHVKVSAAHDLVVGE